MGQAFVYQGSPRDYRFGHVDPGEVAFFEGRPPDEDWVPHVPTVAEEAPPEVVDTPDDDVTLKQPNKAASAADWTAYAEAHGGFQATTGKSPADPATTRKEIVDHYTGGDES